MTNEELDLARFTWNSKVSEEDVKNMQLLREKAKNLAEFIFQVCPSCADRSAAIRDLRVAVMQANLSIAHKELYSQG